MGSGDWLGDARTVRALRRLLAQEGTGRGTTAPENRDELVAALLTARERLRRRLLVAEGIDPGTGQPGA